MTSIKGNGGGFNYGGRFYLVSGYMMEVMVRPREPYICSLCGQSKGERDRKLTITPTVLTPDLMGRWKRPAS